VNVHVREVELREETVAQCRTFAIVSP
jgi:hypothetical protein